MLKVFGFVFASLIFLPISAVAAVINIEYSGYVTWLEGSGVGYQLGDSVSGSVQIDTSKSWGDLSPDADKARYDAIGDPTLVDSISANPVDGYPIDFIEIYNDSHLSYSGIFEDYIAVVDGGLSSDSTGASFFKSLQLYFIFQGVDWLTSDSIDHLNIKSTDPVFIGPSFGVVVFSKSIQNASGEFEYFTDVAGFAFDSINIKPANVNESGSLMLLLIGAFGLMLRRKLY
jgi:hypothetical protein